jgi:hypothetical protein
MCDKIKNNTTFDDRVKKFCRELHDVYEWKTYDSDFWNSSGVCSISNAISNEHGASSIMIKDTLQFCDCIKLKCNKHWYDLFKGVFEGEMSCLQESADSCNPFAQFLYSTKVEEETVKIKYLRKAALSGCPDAIEGYILYITGGEELYEYLGGINDEKRQDCIEGLLPFADMLEKNRFSEYKYMAADIYKNAWIYKHKDTEKYHLKSSLLFVELGEGDTNDYQRMADVVVKGYKKIEKELEDAKTEIQRLRLLKFNTVEDICKSTISEYL